MNIHKFCALIPTLFFINLGFAAVPSEITLGDVVYFKADENIMGNHKSAAYIQKNETLTNWTSKFACLALQDLFQI